MIQFQNIYGANRQIAQCSDIKMENTVREMMSEKIARLITETNRLTGTNQEGED